MCVSHRRQRVVVEEALLESTGAQRVVWRAAAHMTMEGLDDATASDQEDAEDAEEATRQAPEDVYEDVEVLDCGVKYMVGLMSQKTGFYCDQRDSRKLIRQYSANKYAPRVCVCSRPGNRCTQAPGVGLFWRCRRVLDCCCYTGGFALNAAVGGASEVVGVDSSAPALERATQNAKLNHVDDRCRFELSEIKRYLQTAVDTGAEPFDIIVRTLRISDERARCTATLPHCHTDTDVCCCIRSWTRPSWPLPWVRCPGRAGRTYGSIRSP